MNGPVPVGCWNAYVPVGLNVPDASAPWSAPYFFIAVGLCIANAEITSDGKNRPDGRFSCHATVTSALAAAALEERLPRPMRPRSS